MRKDRKASPAPVNSRERGKKRAGEAVVAGPEGGGAPVSLARLIWLLLSAAPPLALVGAVGIYGLAPAYRDEWDEIPLLQKALAGTATWGDWWAAHNEHRIVFSRLIMLANIHLTGWDTRWEMGLSVVLALGLYLLLVRQAGTTARALGQGAPLGRAFFLSLLIFSLGQQENWFWGIQVMMFAVALTSVGALLLLSQPPFTWGRWAAAAGLALAGTGIFGEGLLVWPLGVVALLALRRREPRHMGRALLAWAALGGATCAVYLYHLPHAANATPASLALYEPGQFLAFFLAFLGGPLWFYSVPGAVLMGVLGLGLAAGALVWLRRVRRVEWALLLPYVLIMLFVLANGATSAVGRLGGTAYAALATRYITVSELFWAAAVTLVALAWTAPGESAWQRPRLLRQGLIGALVAGICLFVALDGLNGLMLAQMHYGELRGQIEKVKAGGETAHQEAFGDDHPERDAERQFMVEHQLGMFRPESPTPLPPP